MVADPAVAARVEGNAADLTGAMESGALDCPARTAGLPSAGGGWASGKEGRVGAGLLVLAFLALGAATTAMRNGHQRLISRGRRS
jgi:hypothetical protein